MFKRINDCIIDIEGSNLINTDDGLVFNFDFEEMTVKKITKLATGIYPIKWDSRVECMMIWYQRHWKPFQQDQTAVKYLFESKIEEIILNNVKNKD